MHISLKVLRLEMSLFVPKLTTLVGVLPCNIYQTWSNLEQNIVFVLVYFVFYVQRLCSIGVFVPVLKRPCLISQSGFSLPKLWHSMTVKNRLLIKLFFRTLVILKKCITKLPKEIQTDNGPLEKCQVCKYLGFLVSVDLVRILIIFLNQKSNLFQTSSDARVFFSFLEFKRL